MVLVSGSTNKVVGKAPPFINASRTACVIVYYCIDVSLI